MREIFLSFVFFLSLFSKQLEIEVSAKNAVLMNAETGAILFEKHAHVPAYPASTTKVATTIYVLDNEPDLDKQMKVSKGALKMRPPSDWDIHPPYWLDDDGIMLGLRPNEVLTIETLLHGLMLASANDVANVLAENFSGTIPKFMEGVNEYLFSLGCKNTRFSNPHGLTHKDHWTTAYDLALIMKRALEIPKFRQICKTLYYLQPKMGRQHAKEIKMWNPLVRPKSRYYYPRAIGGKTGYTKAAQYTYVAAAEYEGRTLIAVLLGYEDKMKRFIDAKKVFEKAFSEKKVKRRVIGPETTFKKELSGIKRPICAGLVHPIYIEYFPTEEPNCKAALHWQIGELPIKKGQKIGEVHVFSEDGKFLSKGELMSKEDVKSSLMYSLKRFVSKIFK